MRVLVTGGAGFLGSHLCESLLERGDSVVCVDDLSIRRRSNMATFADDPKFSFLQEDVSADLRVKEGIDAIAHLASPASPPDHDWPPLETLAVGSRGTENALKLKDEKGGRLILPSISEIYGDPIIHPLCEQYWGNVRSIGPRSSGGRVHRSVGGTDRLHMPYLVMPMGILTSAEAAQSALHLVGRFLLMVSMTLFLSYLFFMLCAVVVSGLLSTARSVRKRPTHDVPAAAGGPQSAPLWHVDSAAGRHGARA